MQFVRNLVFTESRRRGAACRATRLRDTFGVSHLFSPQAYETVWLCFRCTSRRKQKWFYSAAGEKMFGSVSPQPLSAGVPKFAGDPENVDFTTAVRCYPGVLLSFHARGVCFAAG